MPVYIAVFVIYFGFIVVTSLLSAKKVESMTDFTTAGHKMGLFLGVGTSLATWLSVASVMGVPGNLYSRGLAAVIGWIAGWFLSTALMPLIAYKSACLNFRPVPSPNSCGCDMSRSNPPAPSSCLLPSSCSSGILSSLIYRYRALVSFFPL